MFPRTSSVVVVLFIFCLGARAYYFPTRLILAGPQCLLELCARVTWPFLRLYLAASVLIALPEFSSGSACTLSFVFSWLMKVVVMFGILLNPFGWNVFSFFILLAVKFTVSNPYSCLLTTIASYALIFHLTVALTFWRNVLSLLATAIESSMRLFHSASRFMFLLMSAPNHVS